MPCTVGRPTSLHFGVSFRPTASVPCTLVQIPTQLREQSPAVDDQKEHLMSDQYLMETSLILQKRVTKTLTKKVGTTGGCNKSYYLLTMNLLELHQS